MIVLPFHILAGLAGIISGAVALYALKGAQVHRTSGLIFVYTMLVMSATGAVLAALKPQRHSLIAAVLTFYLITTAIRTIRRDTRDFEFLDWCALFLAAWTSIYGFFLAFECLNSASGLIDGLPAGPAFMFGGVALLAVVGDLRLIWNKTLPGPHRIARHLWRMCFAMFVATASFFLGQAKLFPAPLRILPVLAIPVLSVLIVMVYWLLRVLFTQWNRGRMRTPTELLAESLE